MLAKWKGHKWKGTRVNIWLLPVGFLISFSVWFLVFWALDTGETGMGVEDGLISNKGAAFLAGLFVSVPILFVFFFVWIFRVNKELAFGADKEVKRVNLYLLIIYLFIIFFSFCGNWILDKSSMK